MLKQQGHFSAEVHCLAYSPAGTVIATGGGDSKVKLWKVGSGFCFVTFTGARARVPFDTTVAVIMHTAHTRALHSRRPKC